MQHQSLDQQLIEYRQKRALAMPLSGMMVWTLLFIMSFILPASQMVMATFIGTGSIVYLAMGVSRLTGENISFKKSTDRNWFETVFLAAMGMSFLTFSISIPFFYGKLFSLALRPCSTNRVNVVSFRRVSGAKGGDCTCNCAHCGLRGCLYVVA
ncbi:MAG: hypothetical protein LRY74_09555 [Shewanella xiamenensis]|nr:hypothetical protein [Shewanella xiamenensis]